MRPGPPRTAVLSLLLCLASCSGSRSGPGGGSVPPSTWGTPIPPRPWDGFEELEPTRFEDLPDGAQGVARELLRARSWVRPTAAEWARLGGAPAGPEREGAHPYLLRSVQIVSDGSDVAEGDQLRVEWGGDRVVWVVHVGSRGHDGRPAEAWHEDRGIVAWLPHEPREVRCWTRLAFFGGVR